MKKDLYTFEEARDVIKEYLPIFLEDKGVNHNSTNSMFSCINPDHDDRKPSMHVYKSFADKWMYYCHGCHITGDIFVANHLLTGAPLMGYEFIVDNMGQLAEEYGIDFEKRAMTAEEIELMNIRNTYSLVKDLILANIAYGDLDDNVKEYIESRKINLKEDVNRFAIGYVPNWDDFANILEAKGMSREYLQSIGIRNYIFNSNNLLFTILDEVGNVKGFAGRNCYFDPEDHSGAKYYNTDNNLLYRKRDILYNLNRSLRSKENRFASLYITEGYTDAITLDKAGFKACALSGTAFSAEHISLLQRVDQNDIVFLLDGDKAGITSTAKAITETMEGVRNFRVRIVTLPKEMDPADYINEFGREGLLNLTHMTAFEWRMKMLKDNTDLSKWELAQNMSKLIVNESSEIVKEQMCELVSTTCDVDVTAIRREVNNLSNNDKIQYGIERDGAIDSTIKALRSNPDDAQIILSKAAGQINDLSSKHDKNVFDSSTFEAELDEFKVYGEIQADEDMLVIRRMPRLAWTLEGSLEAKLALLGGQPGAGKTAILVSTALNILRSQEGAEAYNLNAHDKWFNNVCIFYHTTDDSTREIIPRFITNLAAEINDEVFINAMDSPNRFKYRDKNAVIHARNLAFDKMKEFARDGRLVVKDSSDGSTLSFALQVIRNLKDKYPGRKIIYIVDNLYNLSDFQNLADESSRIKERIESLKRDIVVSENIFSIATVEYRKGQEKKIPSNQALNEMIKETKAIEYRANWIGHLLNEMAYDPENTEMYFWRPDIPVDQRTNHNRSAIITLAVTKNKITNRKGHFHYYLMDDKAVYLEMRREDLSMMRPALSSKLKKYFFRNEEEITRGNFDNFREALYGEFYEEIDNIYGSDSNSSAMP